MRSSQVLKKWRQNQPALLFAVKSQDPAIFELISLMGLDAIWLDMEHAPLGMSQAAQLIRAARVGTADVVARPGKGEFMRMSRLLEAGANLLMYPRCESAAEAREVVRWCKFAPIGERGFDGGNPDSPYGSMAIADYVRIANEHTGLIIQLENQAAVDQANEIAAVKGVDAIMLGPGDFGVLEGFPGQFQHPRYAQARQQIAAAAIAHGKVWGQTAMNAEHARQLLSEGARLVAIGSDRGMIKNGVNEVRQAYGKAGFVFEKNRLDP